MDRDIRYYEPKIALSGGIDGLSKIRLVVNKSSKLIKKSGKLFLEIGSTQASEVLKILQLYGFYNNRVVKDLGKKNRCVISLGGGAFLNKNIKNEILNNHISFWLNWSPRVLIERIKKSKKRPIAFKSTNNELIELIKKRSIIYSKALYKIDCDKLTKNEITNKILDIYEAY